MEVTKLTSADAEQYTAFLLERTDTLFFASNGYRELLRGFLKEEDMYLIAKENGRIVGALPAFIKRTSRGNVINSLPFYGSNGGVICGEERREISKALIGELKNIAKLENCIAATLVSSPFEKDTSIYNELGDNLVMDSRIGQLSRLPDTIESGEEVMKMIDSKMRNIVRKAQRMPVTVTVSCEAEDLKFLTETHFSNMQAIGGIAKPPSFFELIPKIFTPHKDYRIYTAWNGNERIAAVLLFYFNETVEYFTPVIKAEYRNWQPMCLLIYEAMKTAVSEKFRWWNWGGTWHSQGGVYHFKSQWGTSDLPYYYYTSVYDRSIFNSTKEELLENYPYFFVLPFDKLQTKLAQ